MLHDSELTVSLNEIHGSGNWWYDIIDFDVVVQGKPTKVHVHGGLFKSCYPLTYKGTLKILSR